MDASSLLADARALLATHGAADDLVLDADAEAPPHPVLAGEVRAFTLEPAAAGPWTLRLHGGALATGDANLRRAALDAILAFAREEIALARPAPGDERKQAERCYLDHARFRAGADLPRGWHRAGEPVADGIWAVDLDLFVELCLPAARLEALQGQTIALRILGEALPLELPEDVGGDDALTLPGMGLFDDDPATDEDDPLPREGDLHILPIAY